MLQFAPLELISIHSGEPRSYCCCCCCAISAYFKDRPSLATCCRRRRPDTSSSGQLALRPLARCEGAEELICSAPDRVLARPSNRWETTTDRLWAKLLPRRPGSGKSHKAACCFVPATCCSAPPPGANRYSGRLPPSSRLREDEQQVSLPAALLSREKLSPWRKNHLLPQVARRATLMDPLAGRSLSSGATCCATSGCPSRLCSAPSPLSRLESVPIPRRLQTLDFRTEGGCCRWRRMVCSVPQSCAANSLASQPVGLPETPLAD